MALLLLMPLLLPAAGCRSMRKIHRFGNTTEKAEKMSVATGTRLVLHSTAVATAKAPLTSTWTGAQMLLERSHILLPATLAARALDGKSHGPATPRPGDESFEQYLDRKGLAKRSSGRVKFLVDGPPFFTAFRRAIDEAAEKVDVQFYIFDNDSVAVEVADHLKRKSAEVPVRVIYDPLGSEFASKVKPPVGAASRYKSVKELLADMTSDSRVKARATSDPWFVSDHTKLAVFDDTTAFIGGMNIGAEYRHTWHDMMVRVEGPIVDTLSGIFEDHWREEDWKHQWGLRGLWRKDAREHPADASAPGPNDVPLRVLLTDSAPARRGVLQATLAAIRCARERVWIETPYISVDDITEELRDAVKRGVDVRIIVPEAADSKVMTKVNASELRDLLKTNAKVYEYPGVTHLKATVCDGWATFGSANYDSLSMRINRELNLATSDPATVQALVGQVFIPDFRVSKRLTYEEAQSRGGILTEVLGDQL
jgi:cardiolipin synthase